MSSKLFVTQFFRHAAIVFALIATAGCLPSAETDTPEQSVSSEGAPGGSPAQNSAPVISGSPGTQGVVGSAYSFQPQASDADGDSLTFSVVGLPAWASFSVDNGAISGTPGQAHVGIYSGIQITVSDGEDSASLGPFTITVDSIALGSATLSWTAPTMNTDGSPLDDLSGYRIYWGSASGSYTDSVTLNNPGLTTYVVENLVPGDWYFVSTAVNADGVESAFSNEAIKSVM